MSNSEQVTDTVRRRVVVGVSDSPAGRAALRVASDIASRGNRPLHLVRVWRGAEWFRSAPIGAMGDLVAEEHADELMLTSALDRARERAGDVTAEFVLGDLYTALRERTVGAELLVIGTSGREGENSGLVTRWLTDHSHCAVILVDAAERIVDYRSHRPVAHRAAG